MVKFPQSVKITHLSPALTLGNFGDSFLNIPWNFSWIVKKGWSNLQKALNSPTFPPHSGEFQGFFPEYSPKLFLICRNRVVIGQLLPSIKLDPPFPLTTGNFWDFSGIIPWIFPKMFLRSQDMMVKYPEMLNLVPSFPPDSGEFPRILSWIFPKFS